MSIHFRPGQTNGRTGRKQTQHREPIEIEKHRDYVALAGNLEQRAAKEAERLQRLESRDRQLEEFHKQNRALGSETQLIAAAQRRLLKPVEE